MVGGATARIFQVMVLGALISMTTRKKMSILVHKPNKHLALMKELCESDKVKPIIDKRYPLNEVPEAIRYFGKGLHRGKIVITMEKSL
jgi:NADPH:quinone reductase-like Zn-dependent oxidoreductase